MHSSEILDSVFEIELQVEHPWSEIQSSSRIIFFPSSVSDLIVTNILVLHLACFVSEYLLLYCRSCVWNNTLQGFIWRVSNDANNIKSRTKCRFRTFRIREAQPVPPFECWTSRRRGKLLTEWSQCRSIGHRGFFLQRKLTQPSVFIQRCIFIFKYTNSSVSTSIFLSKYSDCSLNKLFYDVLYTHFSVFITFWTTFLGRIWHGGLVFSSI